MSTPKCATAHIQQCRISKKLRGGPRTPAFREGVKKGGNGRNGKGEEKWLEEREEKRQGRERKGKVGKTPHPKKQKFTITLLPFAVSTGAVYYNGFMSVYWCVG